MSSNTATFTASGGFLNPAGFQSMSNQLGEMSLIFAPGKDGMPDPSGNLDLSIHGIDPDTVVSLDGGETWTSFSVKEVAAIEATPAFFRGNDNFDASDPPTAVVIDIGGTEYVFFPDHPDASGPLNGVLKFGPSMPSIVICFCEGTRILTPRGEVPVEELEPGDMVVTRDRGAQPLRWIGRARVALSEATAPVVIRTGALGEGMPARDLRVSPQHRVLTQGPRLQLAFGVGEALVPAVHLVDDHAILRDHSAPEVTYFHLLFDQHEVVWSEGLQTESFHPGQYGMGTLDEAARAEVVALFPELAENPTAYGPAARPSLRRYEAAALRDGLR